MTYHFKNTAMQLIQTTLPALIEGVSKTELQNIATSLVDEVLDRGIPFEMAEKIAATEQLIKMMKADKRLINYVREELDKYKGKYTTESGSKIEAAETGSAYDFTNCNDPVLLEMQENLDMAEIQIKARKEFLKTVPKEGIDIRHEDELITIYPPSKSSTSSYKITLSK
jgi:hypothetical protein